MDNTIMGLMQQNFESKLDAIKKDYEFREEMRSLKEDLKKNDNSTTSLTEILEHLKPFLPMIMSKLGMIASPSIAGNEA
jgi:predicted nucleotidyltransferase